MTKDDIASNIRDSFTSLQDVVDEVDSLMAVINERLSILERDIEDLETLEEIDYRKDV